MTDTQIKNFNKKIDEIIAFRKQNIPEIDTRINSVNSKINKLTHIVEQLSELKSSNSDIRTNEKIESSASKLIAYIESLQLKLNQLNELKKEFTRNTINIGISGQARVGKSTTIQKITGLSDTQVPSGESYPTTAVRSVVYNDSNERAEITFKSDKEFVEGFVNPHLKNISTDDKKWFINSASELRTLTLPEDLPSDADTKSRDSLRHLQDAKADIDSYISLLGQTVKTAELNQVSDYVTYPSAAEVNSKLNKVKNRKYLAVKEAKIYCKFPNLGNAKIGLVDLPGLGEIDNKVSQSHLSGLEDQVDKIFMILRPRKEHSFVDAPIAQLVDQLNVIQPGVKYRSDLITGGINVAPELSSYADQLKQDFDSSVNKGRRDDDIKLIEYNALDENSVSKALENILQTLADRLADMDKQKLEFVAAEDNMSDDVNRVLRRLSLEIKDLMNTLPKSGDIMFNKQQEVGSYIIDAFNALENKLRKSSDEESETYKQFKDDVEFIHDDIQQKLENGLFFDSIDRWHKHAQGQTDYNNFYRDECKRIAREITNCYSSLDDYYSMNLNKFKVNIVDTFFNNAGRMSSVMIFKKGDSSQALDCALETISLLDASEDAQEAFGLIQQATFSFRSNAFLRINDHLSSLNNPSDTYRAGGNSHSKAKDLGSRTIDDEDKIDLSFNLCVADAKKANNSIKKALLNNDDEFNKALYTHLSFFNSALFLKNEEKFKHAFIRSLIEKNQHEFFTNDELKGDPRQQICESIIQSIQSFISKLGINSQNASSIVLNSNHKNYFKNYTYGYGKQKIPYEKQQLINEEFNSLKRGDIVFGKIEAVYDNNLIVETKTGLRGKVSNDSMFDNTDNSNKKTKNRFCKGDNVKVKVKYSGENNYGILIVHFFLIGTH